MELCNDCQEPIEGREFVVTKNNMRQSVCEDCFVHSHLPQWIKKNDRSAYLERYLSTGQLEDLDHDVILATCSIRKLWRLRHGPHGEQAKKSIKGWAKDLRQARAATMELVEIGEFVKWV